MSPAISPSSSPSCSRDGFAAEADGALPIDPRLITTAFELPGHRVSGSRVLCGGALRFVTEPLRVQSENWRASRYLIAFAHKQFTGFIAAYFHLGCDPFDSFGRLALKQRNPKQFFRGDFFRGSFRHCSGHRFRMYWRMK